MQIIAVRPVVLLLRYHYDVKYRRKDPCENFSGANFACRHVLILAVPRGKVRLN